MSARRHFGEAGEQLPAQCARVQDFITYHTRSSIAMLAWRELWRNRASGLKMSARRHFWSATARRRFFDGYRASKTITWEAPLMPQKREQAPALQTIAFPFRMSARRHFWMGPGGRTSSCSSRLGDLRVFMAVV